MRTHRPLVVLIVVAASLAWAGAGIPSAAPQRARPVPGIARTPDGKPDLSGIWQALGSAEWDLEPRHARPGVPASQGVVVGDVIPYQPWALDKRREHAANRATADPESKCYQPGIPRLTLMPFPFQIFHLPDAVLMVHEYAQAVRHIHTTGVPHPRGPIEWWLGDSRGRWEGDTLVVDTVHFTDQTWLDRAGNFHSEALHVVERFTPAGPDHVEYGVTLEDPKVFTKPWQIHAVLYRRKEPNVQLLEYTCQGFPHEAIYP